MTVLEPLPNDEIDEVDPFLMIHHLRHRFPGGQDPLEVGVPPHPHRGFQPVSFLFEGSVRHRDSLGNDATTAAGGVQWTRAGSGIVHSERPSGPLAREGGLLELVQVWINLPSAERMSEPEFLALDPQDVRTARRPYAGTTLRVVAGEIGGLRGPVETPTSIDAGTVHMGEKGRFDFSVPTGHHAMAYVLNGRVRVDGSRIVEGRQLAVLDADGENVHFAAEAPSRILLLTGEPLEEPYVNSGPFVEDNLQRLYQAVTEYEHGEMGQLTEHREQALSA